MRQQLQFFNQFKTKLQRKVGRKQANNQIKEAVFYINSGSEDFALNYFQDGNGGGQTPIPLPKYERFLAFLLKLIQPFIQVGIRYPFYSGAEPGTFVSGVKNQSITCFEFSTGNKPTTVKTSSPTPYNVGASPSNI